MIISYALNSLVFEGGRTPISTNHMHFMASGTSNRQRVDVNGAKAVSCAGGDRSAISCQENPFFRQARRSILIVIGNPPKFRDPVPGTCRKKPVFRGALLF